MPFQKGQSGNPGGRSRAALAKLLVLQKLARNKCKRAIEVCSSYLDDPEAKAEVKLRASEILLDRGLGRPQPIPPITSFSDEELVRELLLRKQVRDADEQRNRQGTQDGDS